MMSWTCALGPNDVVVGTCGGGGASTQCGCKSKKDMKKARGQGILKDLLLLPPGSLHLKVPESLKHVR